MPRRAHDHTFELTVPLGELREYLKKHARETHGVLCPLCRQLVKVYEREITSTMAYTLILLHQHFLKKPDWLHVPTFLTEKSKVGSAVRGGDWAKLRYWGLIEEQVGKRADGSNRAGFYKMTEKGHQFARGDVKVPKSVYLYNDRVLGFDPVNLVGVQECLGKEFDYNVLMGNVVPLAL
jgi:hypothetical protein